MTSMINSLEELENVLKEAGEVILYGAGKVAQSMLTYLSCKNMENNITCVGVECIDGNPWQVESIPVVEIDCLGCFYESALFIIATREKIGNVIEGQLMEYGCKRICRLSKFMSELLLEDSFKKNINKEIMGKRTEQIYKKLMNIEAKIEQQNEIDTLHSEVFKGYEGYYRNRDVVIVGTAPSVKKYTPIEGAIHIGVNRAWLRDDIDFEYLFTTDPYLNITKDEMNKIQERVGKIFVGKYFRRVTDAYYDNMQGYIVNDSKVVRYFSDYTSDICSRGVDIYYDISKHPLYDISTIVSAALHFALYTHPRRIYIVGCDCTLGNHFYDNDEESSVVVNWKVGHARMKMFAKMYCPNTEIISVNPVGLKGLHKEIYTD